MVVAADETWGSIGGGNLEAIAVERARALLADGGATPELLTSRCPTRRPTEHGVQCCGGEVTVLLEPLPVRAGGGDLRDGPRRPRAGPDPGPPRPRPAPGRLPARPARPTSGSRVLADARGRACTCTTRRCSPSWSSASCRAGTHVLVMTHDHAEDARAVRRRPALRRSSGSIGLIGSAAKWARFRAQLPRRVTRPRPIARITTPDRAARRSTARSRPTIAVERRGRAAAAPSQRDRTRTPVRRSRRRP